MFDEVQYFVFMYAFESAITLIINKINFMWTPMITHVITVIIINVIAIAFCLDFVLFNNQSQHWLIDLVHAI